MGALQQVVAELHEWRKGLPVARIRAAWGVAGVGTLGPNKAASASSALRAWSSIRGSGCSSITTCWVTTGVPSALDGKPVRRTNPAVMGRRKAQIGDALPQVALKARHLRRPQRSQGRRNRRGGTNGLSSSGMT